MKIAEVSVLFGGTGFIGTHVAQHLLGANLVDKIVLADVSPPRTEAYAAVLQNAFKERRAEFVRIDVLKPIAPDFLPRRSDLVFNLAAVHREPGHQPREYFETNLCGGENVCAWAAGAGCTRMVFTSSISPYGPSETVKNELSIPTPESPYGSSKLAAEKIHLAWQAADSARRKLLILRPGVVFGPGEGGNVTRLLRSLVKGYFVYMGNRNTRKAAGYVKELCHVMQFGLETLERQDLPSLLLNFSIDPPPTVEQFVSAIQTTAGIHRPVLRVPRKLLVGASYPIATFSQIFGIQQPINPVRVRKLLRSTNVEPLMLRQLGYHYMYTLASAFADWKSEAPEDFQK